MSQMRGQVSLLIPRPATSGSDVGLSVSNDRNKFTHSGHMLLQAQVGWQRNSEQTDVLTGGDDVCTQSDGWGTSRCSSGTVQHTVHLLSSGKWWRLKMQINAHIFWQISQKSAYLWKMLLLAVASYHTYKIGCIVPTLSRKHFVKSAVWRHVHASMASHFHIYSVFSDICN